MKLPERKYKGHPGAHQNPDSKWIVGEGHAGTDQNPDGTWVCA